MADALETLKLVLGDGREPADMKAFLDHSQELRRLYGDYTDPDALLTIRFIELFSVASVEGGREASASRPPEDLPKIINALCLGASIALCSAVISVVRKPLTADQLRSIVGHCFEVGLEQSIQSNDLAERADG